MPSRQPGRRAIIVASIIGLCITLIWAATFRRLYLNTHPLATWEQSTCRDSAPDAANTPPSAGEVLVGVQALVPTGFRGVGFPTHLVMCAFRAGDGALVRRFLLPGRMSASDRNPTFSILRQIGGTLYVSTNDGRICALHATGGELLWCQTTQPYAVSAELIVADDVVFNKTGSLLEAFDTHDGTPLWQTNLNDYTAYSQTHQAQTFVASAGKVYVGKRVPLSDNPVQGTLTFCARAARTGIPDWCQTFGAGALSVTRVELGGDIIFAFVNDSSSTNQTIPLLYALRATDGTVLWKRQLDCASASPPLTAFIPDASASGNGTLLLAEPQCDGSVSFYQSLLRSLIALRAGDGAPRWTATPGVLTDLAVADGVVYLDTPEIGDGKSIVKATTIQALRIADASLIWRFRMPALSPRLTITGDTLLALTGPSVVPPPSYTPVVYALRRADGSELWQSTGCNANLDPYFWHDHILRHEQSAPVWCHWPAIDNYSQTLYPVLP